MQIRKNLLIILKLKTKNEEELWAMEKWKSKIRIPTFPPPRMPAAQGKNGRLHKTLDPSEPLEISPQDGEIPTFPRLRRRRRMEKWKTKRRFSTFPPPRFLFSQKERDRAAAGLRPPPGVAQRH